MYVCVCHAISDSTLRGSIRSGQGDLKSLMKSCGAGSDCGACVKDLKNIIKEHISSAEDK